VAVCAALGLARSSYYASLKPKVEPVYQRPRSHRALDSDERRQVLDVLHSPRFLNSSPAAIIAALLDEGVYLCSVRTMYRILDDEGEIRERRDIARRPAYKKPELLATGPNQVWSWDITKLRTFEKWVYFYLYVLLDVFSRYVVGYLVAESESANLAKELIEESCAKQGIAPGMLTVHSDRGSPMKSKTVSMLYNDLGIDKSFSRPSVSNDNPFSEAQFKTLKYCPLFPGRLGTLTEAREVGQQLIGWYNREHRHSGIGYYTPEQVHYGRHLELHKIREKTLLSAYAKHPERFKLKPTPKAVPGDVWINPPVRPGLTTDLYEKTAAGIFLKK
jgi:putative transposase